MDHDKATDHPRRHAPAGGLGQFLLPFGILELDILRSGKGRAQEMRGAGLKRLAILHHCFDRIGGNRAGETLIFGLLTRDHRHGDAFLGEAAIDFEHLHRFFQRLVHAGVRRMPLLPEKLGGAQEHAGAHFPAHDIGPLVDKHGQIAPRLDPAAERCTDHRFRRRTHDQRLFQLRIGIRYQLAILLDQPVMGDDRHFLGEAVHMLGFLLKIGERNEQRKIAIFMARRLDPFVQQFLDAFPDAIAPWPDDHAAAHAAFLSQVGLGNDGLIPGGKILFAGDGKGVLHGVGP